MKPAPPVTSSRAMDRAYQSIKSIGQDRLGYCCSLFADFDGFRSWVRRNGRDHVSDGLTLQTGFTEATTV